jgi:hypothetical protein
VKLFLFSLTCAATFWFSVASSQSEEDVNVTWLVGTWEKTIDEDRAPSDKITFNADGTWISYGPEDQQRVSSYHFYRGDLYLTVEMQDKGPVSLVFRPSKSHSKLTFTSPRTMKNATYERISNGGTVKSR